MYKEERLKTELILEEEDWTPAEWKTIIKIFSSDEPRSERILIPKGTILKSFINLSKPAPKTEAELLKDAAEVLKIGGAEFPVKLGRFGIYRQYELAGEPISFYMLDAYPYKHGTEEEEDMIDEICTILDFIDEDWLEEQYGRTGQNRLLLNEDGTLDTEYFTI